MTPLHRMLLFLLFFLLPCLPGRQAASILFAEPEKIPPELIFRSEPGVLIDHASNPMTVVREGKIYLYYEDRSQGRPVQKVASSRDGLHFSKSQRVGKSNDYRAVRLRNGQYRRYTYDRALNALVSASSVDGVNFVKDPGIRYEPQEVDQGEFGYYDLFLDDSGGVVLLYIGDLHGVNNLRRAYAKDGWTFQFDRDDVLQDAKYGGGARSFVDPRSVEISGGRRLFVMQQGVIYSFATRDDGKTFAQDPGIRLHPESFYEARSLHDPAIVRLSDGRYRIYVCAKFAGDASNQVIVSAANPQMITETEHR